VAVSTTNAVSGLYTANGVTTVFPFTFKAMTAEEIAVRIVIDSIDTEVAGSDYAITITPTGGGSVAFATAPTAGSIYVHSSPKFTQETSFSSGQPFSPTVVNEALDRAAVRDQYLNDNVKRSITVPVGEEGFAFPRQSERALKAFVFDVDGEPAVAELPSGSVVVTLELQYATAGQTAFTFDGLSDNLIEVKVNGIALPERDEYDALIYSVSGDTITFVTPRALDDEVQPRVLGGWAIALRQKMASATSAGLQTISDFIKLSGIVDMKTIGAQFNNDYDNNQRFIDAVGALSDRGGGKIQHGHWGMAYTSGDLTLSPGITYDGELYPQKPRTSWDYLDTCPSGIILEPTKTIKQAGSLMKHMLIWQADINQNPLTEAAAYDELAKFAGVAFTPYGDDPAVYQCMAIGFDKMAYINGVFRPEFIENIFDCNGGIEATQVLDFRGRGISHNLGQAVYFQYRPWPIAVTRRPGKAIYLHDVCDGVECIGNKSFGYETGLHLKDVFEVKASHIADGIGLPDPAGAAGTRGIWLEGNLNGCLVDASGAHGQETGWYIDCGTYVPSGGGSPVSSNPLQLGNNTCGVAVDAQIYFGPNVKGNIGNFTLSGLCDTPVILADGGGELAGAIDCASTAPSGDMFFFFDLTNDKNKVRDIRRRYFDTTLLDLQPNFGIGEYLFADVPAAAPVGTRILVTNASNAVTAFGTVLAGPGANTVFAERIAGAWRVA